MKKKETRNRSRQVSFSLLPDKKPNSFFSELPGNRVILLCLFVLLSITLVVFGRVMYFDFIQSQDDRMYIIENLAIQHLSPGNIAEIFLHPYGGIYHPLTSLTWMFEYHFFGLNPHVYHTDNLLIHLANVMLVFYFAFLLSHKRMVAFITACLFSIHPMHVESVASISDRKDLLYTFFFLLSLIGYVFYLEKPKKKMLYYFLSVLMFIFSLLSKPSAVVLPLILFIFDYYYQEKIKWKTILDKIPFFLLAILFGFMTEKFKSVEGLNRFYIFPEQVLTSCYALIFYLRQAIIPTELTLFHPYPFGPGEALPFSVIVSPLIIVAGVFIVIWKRLWNFRAEMTGLLFFLASIGMLLHLPVGIYSAAERYSYLPYFGLFFSGAVVFYKITENKSGFLRINRSLSLGILLVIIALFVNVSVGYTKLWKNGILLTDMMVEKVPGYFCTHFMNGCEHDQIGDYQTALIQYQKATELEPDYNLVHRLKGRAEVHLKMYKEANTTFTFLLGKDSSQPEIFKYRGDVRASMGDYAGAIDDYTKVISWDTLKDKVHLNLGICKNKLGRFREAIPDFDRAIELKEGNDTAFFQRGISYLQLSELDMAESDFSRAISMNPANTEAYYNLGVTYEKEGDWKRAILQFTQTIHKDSSYFNAHFSMGNIYQKQKNYSESVKSYREATKFNPSFAPAYYNCGVSWYYLKNTKEACDNWKKASDLGFTGALEPLNKYCGVK